MEVEKKIVKEEEEEVRVFRPPRRWGREGREVKLGYRRVRAREKRRGRRNRSRAKKKAHFVRGQRGEIEEKEEREG